MMQWKWEPDDIIRIFSAEKKFFPEMIQEKNNDEWIFN